jgi:hypothetical protein
MPYRGGVLNTLRMGTRVGGIPELGITGRPEVLMRRFIVNDVRFDMDRMNRFVVAGVGEARASLR